MGKQPWSPCILEQLQHAESVLLVPMTADIITWNPKAADT